MKNLAFFILRARFFTGNFSKVKDKFPDFYRIPRDILLKIMQIFWIQ